MVGRWRKEMVASRERLRPCILIPTTGATPASRAVSCIVEISSPASTTAAISLATSCKTRSSASPSTPVAAAAANPSSGLPPLTVAFSSAGSSDPEGATLTYAWDFGDGATSTQANPTHTYPTAGPYVVKLTISDGVNFSPAADLHITVG